MKVLRLAQFSLIAGAAAGVAGYARRAPEAPERAAPAPDEARDLPAQPLGHAGRTEIPARPYEPPPSPPPLTVLAPPEAARIELPEVGVAGGPARLLSLDEARSWQSGRELFEREWDESEGLGSPAFNAASCATCHNAPAPGGAGGNEFNVIQAQDGRQGHYARGLESREVREPPGNRLVRMRHLRDELKDDRRFASFFTEIQTPSLFGLGRIDTIPDEEILRREDPDDRDGDGIRGVARRVVVRGARETLEVGRFGWKGQTPRLADFVCTALGGETGITAPDQGRGFGLLSDSDAARDPEITHEEFDDLAFYSSELAPPPRGGRKSDPRVRVGEELFAEVGCSACHVPTLEGSAGPVPLYSDLLLHDVTSPPEARTRRSGGRTDEREPTGFRTPPLWGVARTAPYMHDGRATTLRDAILAHAGEAQRSREEFEQLDAHLAEALLAFLEDL